MASLHPDVEEDPETNIISLISWNIDGLDRNNLQTRCCTACEIILREKPDVVFLQEVVRDTFATIKELCKDYVAYPGGRDGYFTTVLLKSSTVKYEEHAVIPFHSSQMFRNLLKVQVEVKGIPCLLMTSHLESIAKNSEERKLQLRKAFKEVTAAPESQTVLFGGDLNIRDKEIAAIGGLPANILDLWEVTGKRPEAKFTWDTSRNDNLVMEDRGFKPKLRFDRVYMRHARSVKMNPVNFELIGMERIASCQRFPSDHWGILARFDKSKD